MNNRISYQPWDFKEVPVDEMKPKEILIDYTNNDVIIVNAEKKVFKFKEFLKNQLSNVLSTTHIDLYNQHLVATHEYNGFMSSEDKKKFDKIVKKFDKVNELINNNLHSKYKINKLDCKAEYGNNVNVSCDIQFGPLLFKMSALVDIDDRPDYNYRDDLICILNRNDELSTVFVKNAVADKSDIVFNDKKYKYVKKYKYYEHGDDYLIPIIKIRRLNNKPIDSDNIFGNVSSRMINNSEIYEIKEKLSEERKILKTNLNIDKYLDDSVLYFLPLNGNDREYISNIEIEKYPYYTESPYGKMQLGSFYKGTTIPIEKTNVFSLEFMLKSNSKSGDIISLLDENFESLYHISVNENRMIFETNSGYHRVPLDQNHKYNTVRLVSCEEICQIYINDIIVKEFDKNEVPIKNVRVDATNVSIGNVIISKDPTFSTNLINENVDIIDSIKNVSEYKKIHREINIGIPGEYKIEGNKISLVVDENIVQSYDFTNSPKVIDIKGNVITLDKTISIDAGDVIKIVSNKLDNYNEAYKVKDKLSDNILILNNPVKSNCLGNYVVDINDGYFIKISSNNELLKSITLKDNVVIAVFKNNIDFNSPLNIDYMVKAEPVHNKFNVIDTVLFGDASADKYDTSIREISNDIIPININGVEYKANKSLYTTKNDIINGNISIHLNDFINNISNDECFDKKIKIKMSSGSNPLTINGVRYHRGNVVSEYIIDIDNELDIETKAEEFNAKLYIDSYVYTIKFKGQENFVLLDEYERISEYLTTYDGKLYSNSDREISIIGGTDNDSIC